MQGLKLDPGRQYTVLCLGAHSDDIEIGCGGTLLQLLQCHDNISLHWVVLGAHGHRTREAQSSAQAMGRNARDLDIRVKGFRDGFFPYTGIEIKEFFEELKGEISPDLVFTHYRHDRHQDHRVVSDLAWNTFRDHFILEYEIPKYDGDMGSPNVFVPLDERICRGKVDHLMAHFPSQTDRRWFSEDTFLSLLRLRGMESNSPTMYAEAFYGRKVVLSVTGRSGPLPDL